MTSNCFNNYSQDQVRSFCNDFQHKNFVYLPEFLTPHGFSIIKGIEMELSTEYMRKDFLMPQSEHSPRKINVIGGKSTNQKKRLTNMYNDPGLMDFIATIISRQICKCDEEIENIIFTSLCEVGDTHGWHTDDYPIALIIGIEAGQETDGGLVEYYDPHDNLQTFHLKQRDAYLIRSDLLKHRVAPLTQKVARTILNFTYAFPGVAVLPNGSANQFCE